MNQSLFPGSQIVAELDCHLSKVNTNISSTNPVTVECVCGQEKLKVELHSIDSLACVAFDITYTPAKSQKWFSDRITKISDDLASRLNYLLEPICPIEFDREAAILQLRSKPPCQCESNIKAYFELVVRDHELCLRRYSKQSGMPRERSSMTLTREVLGRIVTDMAVASKAE